MDDRLFSSRPSESATQTSALGRIRRRRDRLDQIEFYTIAEIAEGLRVSERSVRRWIASGRLPAHRIGGLIRVARNDLDAFLALNRQ